MYSARQIRNKLYVPDLTDTRDSAIFDRIVQADCRLLKQVMIDIAEYNSGSKRLKMKYFENLGYKVEIETFLGVEYMRISW